MKIILLYIIVFGSVTFANNNRSHYFGKNKEDYIKTKEKLKNGTKILPSINKTTIQKDWGACRDFCYQQRNECFDMGGDAYNCDTWYDACVTNCDSSY